MLGTTYCVMKKNQTSQFENYLNDNKDNTIEFNIFLYKLVKNIKDIQQNLC